MYRGGLYLAAIFFAPLPLHRRCLSRRNALKTLKRCISEPFIDNTCSRWTMMCVPRHYTDISCDRLLLYLPFTANFLREPCENAVACTLRVRGMYREDLSNGDGSDKNSCWKHSSGLQGLRLIKKERGGAIVNARRAAPTTRMMVRGACGRPAAAAAAVCVRGCIYFHTTCNLDG